LISPEFQIAIRTPAAPIKGNYERLIPEQRTEIDFATQLVVQSNRRKRITSFQRPVGERLKRQVIFIDQFRSIGAYAV
jgi:hypothetical protein